jgi:hypothetical protein
MLRELKHGEYYFVYQEFRKFKKSYVAWNALDFWSTWFKKETQERPRKQEDAFYYEIMTEMATLMNLLDLKHNFIAENIITNIGTKFIKNKQILVHVDGFIKNLKKAK